MVFLMLRQNRQSMDLINLELKAGYPMKFLLPGNRTKKYLLSFLLIFGLCGFLIVSPVSGQSQPSPDSTDLSNINWSDETEEEEEADLTNESAEENPAAAETQSSDPSGMSWEDEEGENTGDKVDDSFMTMTKAEEKDLATKETRIHFFGFILFIGYILGGVLTGYFSRNRKLAINYPPELLILLHTVWPLEWLFLTFAGKKVR